MSDPPYFRQQKKKTRLILKIHMIIRHLNTLQVFKEDCQNIDHTEERPKRPDGFSIPVLPIYLLVGEAAMDYSRVNREVKKKVK